MVVPLCVWTVCYHSFPLFASLKAESGNSVPCTSAATDSTKGEGSVGSEVNGAIGDSEMFFEPSQERKKENL